MTAPDLTPASPAASWLSRIDELAPLVREDAAAAEAEQALTPRVVEALIEQEPLRLWIPRSLGGPELGLPESLAVFEAAARVDGSFGWAVTIGVGGGLFAAQMEPDFARELFGPREAVIAGSGTVGGLATPTDGGFDVSGRWAYVSGAQYATWFTASCRLPDAEEAPAGEPRRRAYRAMAFPRAGVVIHETWDALGMRATSSHDFSVDNVFVPHERSFDVFGQPRKPGALYRFPFTSIAELSFAVVALGVGLHGLDAFREFAAVKRQYGSDQPLSAAPAVRIALADAEVTLQAAREAFHSAARRAWALVEQGEPVPKPMRIEITLGAINAAQSALRALDGLFGLAGMTPLSPKSEFGRCWRDVRTVAQHALLSPLRFERAGADLFE